MKESTKMEDYDGFQWNLRKIHRTKILPLRWFANLCEKPAHYHLNMYLHHSDHDDYGIACRLHAYVSNIFYKPYIKWGTVYELVTDSESKDS